ncbi:F0F1 ATP synthase subunit B [Pacificimonas sp. WHA3]|uniref:ATP synthase subunit b n=1 Tax=Pacificimonas pallii TaxID=2827236 RepID=A0ABS6SGW1_9SPHN|nr:F0F1 ATP synthase subunit B [Pacificimonas pallii]MBV7257087.1 F0F1 ATP synthase subunit B [Pacificimonas pallii]
MQDAVRSVDVPQSTASDATGPDEIVLDAVGDGTEIAQSSEVIEAESGNNHEYFLGLDSTAWAAVSFFLFVGILLYLKVPAAIAKALDGRGARIRTELDEAKALRAEAEVLLAEQKTRAEQSAKDAEAILNNARTEAAGIVADAEANAAAMMVRRQEAAEGKIAAAERAAEADLKARVATLATTAAATIIRQQTGDKEQGDLTDRAIADLGARLN